MNTKKLTISAMLIAIGTLASHLIFIPIGVAKCFPIQHTINVISAVMLGPGYALMNATLISILRNMLGVGSLLAFPGSMIGAAIAGLLYVKFKNTSFAITGEILGTGIIGGLLAFPISKFILGQEVIAFTFIVPFLVSSIGGSIIAYIILKMHSIKR